VLSCKQMLDLLGEHLDDETAGDVRQRIVEHLGRCRTCTALYDSATKTLRVVTESSSFELPSGLSDRILDAVRAGHGSAPDRD